MAWQLQELHWPSSAINASLAPDSGADEVHDAAVKCAMKGELVRFLERTAREFATRSVEAVAAGEVVGLIGSGFGEHAFVIHHEMVPSGIVLCSTHEPAFTAAWFTSPGWAEDANVVVTSQRHAEAYEGEALVLSFRSGRALKKSLSAAEAGVFKRQPSYDDVNGHPHFVMDAPSSSGRTVVAAAEVATAGGGRRHIFWSRTESRWLLAAVCNETRGVFAVSMGNTPDGSWATMPPVVSETGRLAPVYAGAPADAAETGEAAAAGTPALRLLPWAASNRECLLFSRECADVSFLSLDGKKLASEMHPHLLSHLRANGVRVGEDLQALNVRYHEVLGTLTGVKRTSKEARALLGGSYCITGDSLLKMLAIHVRAACGLPVVLSGECGCGKTMLIRFLAEWLGAHLLVLNVHGGTTIEDIESIFAQAADLLAKDDAEEDEHAKGCRVMVFLDELNASSHVTLLAEAVSARSLFGRPIPHGVQLLAAINPYRKRPLAMRAESAGLVFNLHTAGAAAAGAGGAGEGGAVVDPMADLQFVFDFGSLGKDEEAIYVKSIVGTELARLVRRTGDPDVSSANSVREAIQLSNTDAQCVAAVLIAAQRHVRTVEADASAVSLRDVQRCCSLIGWFTAKLVPRASEAAQKARAVAEAAGTARPVSQLAVATSLALAFAYVYRLPRRDMRNGFWEAMRAALVLRSRGADNTRAWLTCGFARLTQRGSFERVLEQTQRKLTGYLVLDEDVALNEALAENCFVGLVCVLNKLPLFLVGKPGSSKTLAVQVLAANLQGKQSPSPFFKNFPSVHLFSYQAILRQFDMAVRFQAQQSGGDSVTLLLLDE
ncbi:hypothetical protein T492DRAFT_904083, partial [Pavlovales sp. CCMP2436]